MIYLVEGVDAREILPLDDISLMRALSTNIYDLSQPQNHSSDFIDEYFRNPTMREFSAKAQGLNGLMSTIMYIYHYLVYHQTSI